MKGRPTLYQDSFCDELIEHMGKGFSFESFAGVKNCSRSVLYDWIGRHAEFSETKAIATEKARYWWEQKLLMSLDIDKSENAIIPNTTLIIFALKNRLGWRDRVDIDADIKSDVTATVINYSVDAERLSKFKQEY